METVSIPGTVKQIGRSVFEGCVNLKNVFVSDGVGFIGLEAFANCPELRYVSMPENLKSSDSMKRYGIPNEVVHYRTEENQDGK